MRDLNEMRGIDTENRLDSLFPSRYQRIRNHDFFWYFVAGIVAVIILVFGVMIFRAYSQHHTRQVVVTGKDRVCSGSKNGNSSCNYLIFTSGGTFKIGDSLIILRYDSSDVYGQIIPCHRYDLTYYGWRLPLFSDYPNVVKATDLGRVEGCTS